MPEYGDDNVERTVRVPLDRIELEGTLGVPAGPASVVLFAHGSGSSRFSTRNRYVARVLRDAGFATLLIDLLTPREEQIDEVTRHHRFDIAMLSDRLVATIDWLPPGPGAASLRLGPF